MDNNMALLQRAIDTGELIAGASSERPNSHAWTALSIYRLHDREAGQSYVAVISGRTIRAGEIDRYKVKEFPSVARCLGWSEFEVGSKLFAKLRSQAIDWMEAKARETIGRDRKEVVGLPCFQDRAFPIHLEVPVKVDAPTCDSFLIQQNSLGASRRFVGVVEGLPLLDDDGSWILRMRLVREIQGDSDA